ncbi:hypothetical protein K470DRAFT_77231 [Piedraia hortae CBS 480.64]|uniref:Uncharacterized protein n=1 Tax=Piedraia hortae CBS 480.64 TaxID=1314780 RepID=A0A6A7BYS2_9PEZI|nr:hypothetical protein K470DRAFT_77231 [Piedraia hortae CBS 480.64]
MSSGSSSNPWQDRRGLFQRGKEVHEPSKPTGRRPSEGSRIIDSLRRASVSSTNSLEKTKTASSDAPSPTSPSSQRRMSSNAGIFGNLAQMKRGSEDYGQRRQSQEEMIGSGSGIFSTWYNSTFKGVQKTNPTGTQQSHAEKRGVME